MVVMIKCVGIILFDWLAIKFDVAINNNIIAIQIILHFTRPKFKIE